MHPLPLLVITPVYLFNWHDSQDRQTIIAVSCCCRRWQWTASWEDRAVLL